MKWILVGVCLVIGIAEIHSAAGERCRAGSKWTSPCFDCACSEEGKPVCKRRSCADAAEAKDVWECEPRTSWKNDCNWCHCSDNGRPLCTRRGCEAPLPPQTHPIQDKGSNSECKPDTAWTTDDCSSCKCINGKSVCTKITCNGKNDKATEPTVTVAVSSTSPQPTAAPAVDEATVSPVGRECAIGTRWESQCGNTCVCSPSGYGACTEKGCEGYDAAKDFKCKPESTWSDDCNTCFCTFDGKPACTRVACDGQAIKIPEINFGGGDKEISSSTEANLLVQAYGDRLKREVCTPNENFQNECNVCTCNEEGNSYKCTQNECMGRPPGPGSGTDEDVEVFMENQGTDHIERHSVCQPSSTFQINCHTCECNDDGTDYRCSDEPCPLPDDVELFKELQDEARIVPLKKCDPNGYFYDNCNKCRCNEDGTDYKCTKTACNGNPTMESKKQEAKSSRNKSIVCQANKAFQKDCNTCWCNDDGTGYFCTRKVCVPTQLDDVDTPESPEELRIIEKECRPHEVFEVECNMCRCNEDGKSFSCTRRACVTDAPTDAVDFEPKVQNLEVEVVDEPASKAPTRVKRQEKPELQTSPTKVCDPKSKFRLDCNTCLCDKRGSNFSCTRLDCSNGAANNAKRRRREVRSQKKKCEPGSVFTQACNVCRCATDGQHATCTRNRCPTLQDITDKQVSTTETGFRCTPGEQFKRSCNDCTCSADGKSVFCTIKLCENEIVSQL